MPIQPTAELIKGLQKIAEDLLEATDADRTTVRVDATNDPDLPVLAEARKPGVIAIMGGMSLGGYKPVDIHATSTVTFLRETRQMIVQRDARVDPPVLPELVQYYGIAGQMLTPLDHDGQFVGLVSVHSVEPRDWSEDDRRTIERATESVHAELERGNWVEVDRPRRTPQEATG